MRNLVIVGISDTADRICLFVERYKLFNIIGCTVNEEYMPESGYATVGGEIERCSPWKSLTNLLTKIMTISL